MTFIDMLNPYAWMMTLRRALYRKGTLRSSKVSVPVISIGNITSGGSGKSPITKLIAEYLRDELHKKPAIVMRGFKRKSKGFLFVSDGRQILADVNASGDEAQSYARELGGVIVVCDKKRVNGANEAIKKGADVILLDDGFQHMALKRDCNILLLDKYSGQHVIPFGNNREDVTSTSDADVILLTGENEISIPVKDAVPIVHAALTASHITFLDTTHESLDYVRGKRVLALSSIAHPERFHALVSSLGANVVPYVLEDHADYSSSLVADIIHHSVTKQCDCIITTSKDIVKSHSYFEVSNVGIDVGVLHIKYSLSNDKLWKRIESFF